MVRGREREEDGPSIGASPAMAGNLPLKICVCVVDFDLVSGQVCRLVEPSDALGEAERKAIAYHAFPDSKSIELTLSPGKNSINDTLFHFRIRSRQEETVSSQGWHYAYAFCRQRHDPSLPRGGDQISVVVVANIPVATTLLQVTKFAGEVYFNKGEEALSQVVDSVRSWGNLGSRDKPTEALGEGRGEGEGDKAAKAPSDRSDDEGESSGDSFDVFRQISPRGGKQLTVRADEFIVPVVMPEKRTSILDLKLPERNPEYLGDAHTRMAFSKVCLYSCLSGVAKHLWRIWEAVLVGEPCMIFGSNPEMVSSSVAACMDLIFPLPYSADYRPYFTIHDKEFAQVQNSENCGKDGNPSLIGVTNTYFLKAYATWPTILTVGGGDASGGLSYNSPMSSPRSPHRGGGWGKSWFSFKSEDRSNLINTVDSFTQDLFTTDAGLVKENYRILGSLDLVSDDASEMQWATSASLNTKILRRHFQEVTEAFLGQLDPYAKGFYDAKGQEEVLASLATQQDFPTILKETVSSDRTKLLKLYQKFCSGPNFKPWFEGRGRSDKR